MATLGYCYSNKNNMAPVVNLLLDAGANVNSPPSNTHTSALQAAVEELKHAFVDRLLDLGADVNAHDPRFGTALSSAARWSTVELVRKLVEKGADPTLAGEKSGSVVSTPFHPFEHRPTPPSSPLQAAARRRSVAAVEYLLSLPQVDVMQLSGRTGHALHAAARCQGDDGVRVMRLLLDAGADPNACGGKYNTALQAAAKHGNLENVKFLLRAGADPSIEGGKYGSALKAATAKKKHFHVANLLKRYVATERGGR